MVYVVITVLLKLGLCCEVWNIFDLKIFVIDILFYGCRLKQTTILATQISWSFVCRYKKIYLHCVIMGT